MKMSKLLCLFAITALLGSGCAASSFIWAKGQIHDHTTNSDGNGSPQQVADWYRTHGYQFLIITDHEKVTDPSGLSAAGFVLIPGEELAVKNQGAKPIHGNALNIPKTIPSPDGAKTQSETLGNLVDYIRRAGGIPMVNHPNWEWAFTHRELLPVKGPYLLEIANMSSGCNNEGSYAVPSMEQMWDILLSNGREVYATATDDMHNVNGKQSDVDSPGRGWVVARVKWLDPKEIVSALAKGDFYASTGTGLADYSFDGKTFRVEVVPEEGKTMLIRFVGKWGAILQETVGNSATYRVISKPGANDYVRCKVISSDLGVAWTQAYRLK